LAEQLQKIPFSLAVRSTAREKNLAVRSTAREKNLAVRNRLDNTADQ